MFFCGKISLPQYVSNGELASVTGKINAQQVLLNREKVPYVPFPPPFTPLFSTLTSLLVDFAFLSFSR